MCFDNCSAGGMDLSPADACWTPPVPIVVIYVIIGLRPLAANPSPHIFTCGGGVHNILTIIPVVFGDEPGCCGGVISGTFMCFVMSITSSVKCLVDGGFVTRTFDLCIMNAGNTIGLTIAPCQLKVMTLS